MKYQPILGTLGYILSPDQKKVLLVHRTSRKEDDHFGKYNGLGGKMHPDENIAMCMEREIHEEAGIQVTNMKLRGTINWTGFGPKGEDWLGFIFLITGFEGNINPHSPEGPLEWVDKDKIFSLPMWEGDRHFLPLVFDDNPKVFHGFMPYKNNQVMNWTFTRL